MSAVLGNQYVRADGLEKVTGAGRYTADLNLTGQLHAKFRYADHTSRAHHAHRRREGARAARACSPCSRTRTCPTSSTAAMVKDRRLFAKDKVRYEGDVVAGVAALTPEIAEQAVGLIEVEYEPLPPIVDIEAALGRGRPADPRGVGGLRGRRGRAAATATCSATRRS